MPIYWKQLKNFKYSPANSTLIITTDNMNKVYDGQAVSEPTVEKTGSTKDFTFTWYQKQKDGSWKDISSAPINVGNYKVTVSVEADGNYNNTSAEKEFVISQKTNSWTEELMITDWTYKETANNPKAKSAVGTVQFTYSDKIDGTYKDSVPTNAGTWYVKATVTGDENYTGLEDVKAFTIKKADSSVAFKDSLKLDKTYDSQAVKIKDADMVTSGSNGAIQFAYEEWTGDKWQTLTETPTNAGTYRVIATLAEDNNYHSATSTPLEFTISKIDSTINFTTETMDKIYNEEAVENPTVDKTGSMKDVIFTWYQKQTDGSFKDISSAPVNVGSYKVVASIDTDNNYNSTSAEKEFTITKGVPKYQIPTDLSMKQSEKLSEVKLTDGFSWKDETQLADKYGKQTFKAIFTPTDTENYQIVEVDITVDVLPLPILVNHAPVITAEDKELTVGDTFNDTIALKGVTATDKEDGNITESIEVIKNTVDTTKAGTYEVTYKITDCQGVSVNKDY